MDRRPGAERALRAALPAAAFLLVPVLMSAAAELTGEREIIFPEATAIALGALAAPHLAWRTDKLSIFLLIGICAAAGMLIVRFVPLALEWQLALAYLLGQLMLLCSRTSFAPLISAIVLPVLLQTRSPIYLAAAIVLTASVLLVRAAFERAGIRPREQFSPLSPGKEDCTALAARTLFASLVCIAAVRSGFLLLACPPLLVAFTEFTRPGSRAMRTPVRTAALLTACAAAGALCRMLVCETLSLPLALAAAPSAACVLALAQWQKLMLPPAAAMAVLAMLVLPAQLPLYPLQAACGAALYAAFAKLYALRTAGVPSLLTP